MKKVMISGVKPTGRPHIGNYFGAMRQFVALQDEYDSFVMIADLHALTTIQNKDELSRATLDVAIDYLAIGLDPEKTVIFRQSDVPAHSELAWIFNCITTMPYLMRAHAYKDAEAKNKEVSVGTFDYPLLMAADILLYEADVVPVGLDQKQHVEIARDTAEKFNRIWGETFKLPNAAIMKDVAVIAGTDGQKMSKSYNNTIPLFASDAEIEKAVMGIVTDSSAGVPKNVYDIHKLFRSESELAALYEDKKGKYKELKEALAEDIKKFIAPLRVKREAHAADSKKIVEVLAKGAEKARAKANQKMATVRERVGLTL